MCTPNEDCKCGVVIKASELLPAGQALDYIKGIGGPNACPVYQRADGFLCGLIAATVPRRPNGDVDTFLVQKGQGGVDMFLDPLTCSPKLLPLYRLTGLDARNDLQFKQNGVVVDTIHIPTLCEGVALLNAGPQLKGGDSVVAGTCLKSPLPNYSLSSQVVGTAWLLNLHENSLQIDQETLPLGSMICATLGGLPFTGPATYNAAGTQFVTKDCKLVTVPAQTLAYNPTTRTISISDGNSQVIPPQLLTFDPVTRQLCITDGNCEPIPDLHTVNFVRTGNNLVLTRNDGQNWIVPLPEEWTCAKTIACLTEGQNIDISAAGQIAAGELRDPGSDQYLWYNSAGQAAFSVPKHYRIQGEAQTSVALPFGPFDSFVLGAIPILSATNPSSVLSMRGTLFIDVSMAISTYSVPAEVILDQQGGPNFYGAFNLVSLRNATADGNLISPDRKTIAYPFVLGPGQTIANLVTAILGVSGYRLRWNTTTANGQATAVYRAYFEANTTH